MGRSLFLVNLQALQSYSWQLYQQMNSFTGIFQHHLSPPHAPLVYLLKPSPIKFWRASPMGMGGGARGGGGAASPNFQHLCETLQILHYNCIKQHKNIEKLLFFEQNIVISFCPSLCLLWFVVSLPFSTAHVFQFFDTVLCKILNVTSD